MAQKQFRLSLTDAQFPLLSEQQGRTVMGATSEEMYAKDNKPGLFYCHNVMPTKRGLDSIGYKSLLPSASSSYPLLDVRVAYSTERKRVHLAWNSYGEVYALEKASSEWTKLAPTSPSTLSATFSPESVTIGRVNGISYIFYSGIGAFTYNSSAGTLDSVSLTGLDASTVLGVVASSGYLIAYTEAAIAWSSTLDPTDFAPSQVTGAGGGNVAGIGGSILFCTVNSLGILIYTETNTVAATYTGNTQYPFKFRPVDNSKGGVSLDLTAYEANTAAQFVYTTGGLQSVTSQTASIILPEVTDFLAGSLFEDFSEETESLVQTELSTTLLKKMKFISSRYLIISYGISSFTHALVYDAALERLGKLKVEHTDVFEYVGDLVAQIEVSKENIAFLSADGSVTLLDFSTQESNTSAGVAYIGKLQFTKSSMITLLNVELENIRAAASLKVVDLYSLDGKNTSKRSSNATYISGLLRRYPFLTTATNHTLQLQGQFNLTSALITYKLAGSR